MKLRLDVELKDIVGLTWTKIVTAFIGGEKSGEKLAGQRHYNCQKVRRRNSQGPLVQR
jgi:hypothetical protein